MGEKSNAAAGVVMVLVAIGALLYFFWKYALLVGLFAVLGIIVYFVAKRLPTGKNKPLWITLMGLVAVFVPIVVGVIWMAPRISITSGANNNTVKADMDTIHGKAQGYKYVVYAIHSEANGVATVKDGKWHLDADAEDGKAGVAYLYGTNSKPGDFDRVDVSKHRGRIKLTISQSAQADAREFGKEEAAEAAKAKRAKFTIKHLNSANEITTKRESRSDGQDYYEVDGTAPAGSKIYLVSDNTGNKVTHLSLIDTITVDDNGTWAEKLGATNDGKATYYFTQKKPASLSKAAVFDGTKLNKLTVVVPQNSKTADTNNAGGSSAITALSKKLRKDYDIFSGATVYKDTLVFVVSSDSAYDDLVGFKVNQKVMMRDFMDAVHDYRNNPLAKNGIMILGGYITMDDKTKHATIMAYYDSTATQNPDFGSMAVTTDHPLYALTEATNYYVFRAWLRQNDAYGIFSSLPVDPNSDSEPSWAQDAITGKIVVKAE